MKYLKGAVPETAGQLRDLLGDTMLRAPQRKFPEHKDFDGAFYSASLGVENLRKRFGNTLADQLIEMVAQAKAHYQANDNRLGGALLEDAKALVMNRHPWAYPKELYRWRLGSSFPELTEADLLKKEEL